MSGLENSRADIQAVDRTGRILELFADGEVVTTNEVARALGLNRTTAHRYLISMAAEDLLQASTDPPGYRLGSLLLRLGGLTLGRHRIAAIAADRMSQLADEVQANTSLSVWAPAGPVVTVVQEPKGRHAVLTFRVGTVLPLETAQGAVLLAFGRDDVEAAIESLPEPARSITRSKITEARRTGFATAVTEAMGTCGLAAPIFDGSGGVAAALAIVDSISALSAESFPRRLEQLRAAAGDLTLRLGGRVTAPL